MSRQHRGRRSPRGNAKQEAYHLREVIRGRTFFDRTKRETVQLEYGSATIGGVRIWTDPGEVLTDPYGRGTLDRIV